jgi:cytochrome b
MQKIRAYHATLAILSALSYVTGELGIIHSWLGYGVAVVICFRLLWALSGNPHVGLMRFYPSFGGLNLTNVFSHPSITKVLMLGIALCLLGVIATGISLEKGNDIGLSGAQLIAPAHADGDDSRHDKIGSRFYDDVVEEWHELFANLLIFVVGMHASYLLLLKRPLAKFMLFLNNPNK